MLRGVFNAATLPCAMLLALTLAAWLRSHRYCDTLSWKKTDAAATRRRDFAVISGAGGLWGWPGPTGPSTAAST